MLQYYDLRFNKLPAHQKAFLSEVMQLLLEWSRIRASYSSGTDENDSIPLLDICFADGRRTMELVMWNRIHRVISQKRIAALASQAAIALECRELERRLRPFCPDFLMVFNTNSNRCDEERLPARVQFAHHTVLEYSKRQEDKLRQYTQRGKFNPSLSLIESVVGRLAGLSKPRSRQVMWDLATAAMIYAHHFELSFKSSELMNERQQTPETSNVPLVKKYVKLMRALDVTMQIKHKSLLGDEEDWTNRTYLMENKTGTDRGWQSKKLAHMHWSNFHPKLRQPLTWKNNFASIAVQFGLSMYLIEDDDITLSSKQGRPLLDYALCPLDTTYYHLVTVDLVRVLLNNAGDVRRSRKFDQHTSWQSAVIWTHEYFTASSGRIVSNETQKLLDVRLDILALMFEHDYRRGKERCKLGTQEVCYYDGSSEYQESRQYDPNLSPHEETKMKLYTMIFTIPRKGQFGKGLTEQGTMDQESGDNEAYELWKPSGKRKRESDLTSTEEHKPLSSAIEPSPQIRARLEEEITRIREGVSHPN
ncbi:hypothetical protein GGR57DRAFT_154367 [Xylariaceae sp. FL1272]|nr:hypothetical protein GGR57DRAFT_154367 [Xylariaceae sp. FL1272]